MANQAREAEEAEMGEKMVSALDNLANAAVQKNDTVEQLVKSNAILTNTIKSQQEEIKRLHEILSTLSHNKSGKGDPNPDKDKGWDPKGYCYWHGFKVKHGHSSLTCDKGKKAADYEQHKNAKRGDEQGGCTWNSNWGK